MIALKDKDKMLLQKDLSLAIFRFSYGKLSDNQSKGLAKKVIKNIDFSNSALAHKGVNWFAKEIIDVIDFDALN